jgi:hypothetical protein
MYDEQMGKTWSNILNFNNKYFPGWRNVDEIYYSNALAGEVGELCNMVKHRAGGGTNHSKPKPGGMDIVFECADIFIYLSLLLERNGVDIVLFNQIINDKIDKNILRMDGHTRNGDK